VDYALKGAAEKCAFLSTQSAREGLIIAAALPQWKMHIKVRALELQYYLHVLQLPGQTGAQGLGGAFEGASFMEILGPAEIVG
jgi:hypothetical protein